MNERRFDAAAVSHDGNIYIAGGRNRRHELLFTCDRYDILSDSWIKMPDMNHCRRDFCLLVHQDRLYAIGGHDGHTCINSVEYLDLRHPDSVWVMGPSMSPERIFFGACVLEDDLVAMGGSTDLDPGFVPRMLRSIEVLNLGDQGGCSGHWTLGFPMCQPMHSFPVVSVKMTPALRAMAEAASQNVIQVKRMERIPLRRQLERIDIKNQIFGDLFKE